MNNILITINFNNFDQTKEFVSMSYSYNIFDLIIIVDNKSIDDSLQRLKGCFSEFKDIIILESEYNSGFARGNNLALNYIKNKNYNPLFVTFINPDIVYNSVLIQELESFLKTHDDYCCASSLMLNYEMKSEVNYWDLFTYKDCIKSCLHYFGRNYRKKEIKTDNVFFDADVIRGSLLVINWIDIQSVDFFDSNTFLYWEEDCLSMRFKKISKREAIITTQNYIHNHKLQKKKISVSEKLNKNKLYCKSMFYYCNTYLKINPLKKVLLKIFITINYVEKFFLTIMYNFYHFLRRKQ